MTLIVSAPLSNQYSDPIESETTAAEQAANDQHNYAAERIQFAVEKNSRKVLFNGGIELGGTLFNLVAQLLVEFEFDLDAGTLRNQYRFVNAVKLANRVRMNEASLRRAISRGRRQIETAFANKFGRTLNQDDVIQNFGWNGYRLNPYLLLVKPVQLRDEATGTSQVQQLSVTSRSVGH